MRPGRREWSKATLVTRKAARVGLHPSVHIATRCALVSTTDRWDTRLGGLEDRNKSAQAQVGGTNEPTIWPTVAYHDCHIDSPNICAVSGAGCGVWCSNCRGHHARPAGPAG